MKNVSEETLYNYYKKHDFNPTTFSLKTENELLIHKTKRNNLYVNKLGLPNLVWKDTNVLEVGCSSGENSLILAKLGAKFTFVEPLQSSVDKLKELFKHWGIENAINEIYIAPIDIVQLNRQYDIIIAEGFIHTLSNRKEVLRKLFKHLEEDGLLILSTNDTTGCFLEYFKTSIAQLYCKSLGITKLEEKVEAIRPFFEPNFNTIPHTRPFASWAKDVLFNPLIPTSFYDFTEIISDLLDLQPLYYSSWPSYKHSNDLVWHKRNPVYNDHINTALNGYKLRCMSYLLGEPLPEKEAMQILLSSNSEIIVDLVRKTMNEMTMILLKQKSDSENLYNSLRELHGIANGKLKKVIKEMLSILNNLKPEIYLKCNTIKKYWGVPYHYIILGKWHDRRSL